MSKPISFISNKGSNITPFQKFVSSLPDRDKSYALGIYNTNKTTFSELEIIDIIKESLNISVEDLASVLK